MNRKLNEENNFSKLHFGNMALWLNFIANFEAKQTKCDHWRGSFFFGTDTHWYQRKATTQVLKSILRAVCHKEYHINLHTLYVKQFFELNLWALLNHNFKPSGLWSCWLFLSASRTADKIWREQTSDSSTDVNQWISINIMRKLLSLKKWMNKPTLGHLIFLFAISKVFLSAYSSQYCQNSRG